MQKLYGFWADPHGCLSCHTCRSPYLVRLLGLIIGPLSGVRRVVVAAK